MPLLSFDVKNTPPTQAQIDASKASARRKIFLMFGAGIAQAAVAAACVFLTLGLEWESTAHTVSMVLSYVFVLSALFTFFLASEAGDKADSLNQLARKSCPQMLQFCGASEAGRAYQEAVIAQGRSFVEAEFAMMRAAYDETAQEAACKQLHGVPA